MKLEERIREYGKADYIIPNNQKIDLTIRKSKEMFYFNEQKKVLNRQEFLWIQLGFIRKRWWVFQVILLLLFALWMIASDGGINFQREMGVIASLFVILIIPEFWKNRTYQAVELEGTSFYSLRQIYAARMILFTMVDVVLLSIFCGVIVITFRVTLIELIKQFLLPMSVTACICFRVLCSRRHLSEIVAIAFCMIWSGVWALVLTSEVIYTAIAFPIWLLLFGISIFYLGMVVGRILSNCYYCWEEKKIWN